MNVSSGHKLTKYRKEDLEIEKFYRFWKKKNVIYLLKQTIERCCYYGNMFSNIINRFFLYNTECLIELNYQGLLSPTYSLTLLSDYGKIKIKKINVRRICAQPYPESLARWNYILHCTVTKIHECTVYIEIIYAFKELILVIPRKI